MAARVGDRVLPGRLPFWLTAESSTATGIAMSIALVLVTRLPLRTQYLLNWDAVQFALGMRQFDITHHQPHPPGYIGYLLLGRLFQLVFSDPNTALVVLSIVAECAGVALAFFFASRVFGVFAGWVTALAMLTSPLFWYYGEAANTYALEPFLALLVGWFCWRVWNGDAASARWAGLALAGAGALRPSTMVLLTPLFLLSLARLRERRPAVIALLVCGVATLAWVVPLLVLSGGPIAYVRASLQLGSAVSSGTAIWEQGPLGLAITTDGVARGLGWELGPFAIIFCFALIALPLFAWRRPAMPGGWWTFTFAWALPGLFTFLFIHIGQVVYVQVFVPVLMLALGPALVATVKALGKPSLATPLVAAMCVFNVFTFFVPPRYSLHAQLSLHDVRVREMTALVGIEDPATTLLVTDASGAGSYRSAQFYLPAYHRLGVGRDRHGRLGEIYADRYDLGGFDHAQPIPTAVARNYVILDREVVDNYIADPERLHVRRLGDGSRLYFWSGQAPRIDHGELWLGALYRERRGVA